MSSNVQAFNEPNFWGSLLQRRNVSIGLILLSVITLAAIFAPLIAPVDPGAISVRARLSAPGDGYLLGSDEFGRDIFSRIVYAGRISLSVGLGVAVLSSIIGIALGLVGGFFRRMDAPISRIIDAMMAFPDILLAISLVAAFGGSLTNIILALSIVYTPRIARIVRAATLVIRELTYVEAARALGVSNGKIMLTHILRNMVSPVIVQATFVFAYSMLAEAGLSFLGVGVDASTPSWGTMINAGRQYIDVAPWMIFWPGLAITLSVLSLQIVGDGLRDALDPRISRQL